MWQDVVQWALAAHVLVITGALMMLLLIVSMLRQARTPSASVAWLLFLILLPYIGVPLYLLFGSRKFFSAKRRPLSAGVHPALPTVPSDPVRHFLDVAGMAPPAPAEGVRFHAGAAEARSALKRLLGEAQTSIDVCVFLLGDDVMGRKMLDLLAERARAGVRVRLLLDGVGSFLLPKRRLRPLQQAGGETAWFVPLLRQPFRGRTNLRNHRKLVIVDGARVWAGGRNIGAEYLADEAQSHWWDLSFELGGAAVADFQQVFEADWAFARGQARPESPAASARLPAGAGEGVQLVPAGPDMAQDVLHDLLVLLMTHAQDRIVLVSPYFVPDEVLQTMLRLAAQRGVRVELILPRRSNHRLADLARGRALRELAHAGVRVYLLPDAMLHAKAVLIDGHMALAGSANLDPRSLLLNFELMVLFHDRADVAQLAAWVEGLRSRCPLWQPTPPGVLTQTLEGLVLLTAFQL
ncbi:phospholipase D-like domain-containing protein [Nitrogeniibacter aestuarii]|uniref:phospholipase D-like domain-containing protein n=1 Tax=Nitrogeniibacter aestuarii TaxID=2815343 RepID=UPI001E601CAC|nr:phospholipase D-like domain-containing protein [Nitrogeniibacter aestuarii]